MFGSVRNGASAYAKVGLETGVVAASPHKLIVMLFEGAITALNSARVHMDARRFEQKGKAISKAIQIIEEGMRASLDKKAGGEIAANLDALYVYVVERLVQANLHNQTELLDEARSILSDLKGAWEAIDGAGAPAAAPAAVPAPSARPLPYDALAPHPAGLLRA